MSRPEIIAAIARNEAHARDSRFDANNRSMFRRVAATDIAAENTRAVLRAARANRHLLLTTINGPFRCWQCDTSRAFEVDHCDRCGEITSAYADGGVA